MHFTCGGEPLDMTITRCVVAGWTARDRSAIDHHIQELAELGVKPPSSVPLYYRVSASLLTQSAAIQVVGESTSGEVEPFILQAGAQRYLGLASDHTDRELEAHSVALSKQICPKPCAGELWALQEVDDHLDEIALRSWIKENGEWKPYQDGRLSAIRPLEDLIEGAGLNRSVDAGVTAMLCGTFGVISGGVRSAPEFRMEIHDPVMDRTIRHGYAIESLPAIS